VNNSKRRRLAKSARKSNALALNSTATGCALLLMAAAPGVRAQQAPATGSTTTSPTTTSPTTTNSSDQLEEIQVTGIRRAIEDAIAIKRDSDLIVEAISAEDLGKLPDLSIADSLARLPGIAVQRDQFGEATQVSIRGFGPDFVGTTLNGREQTSTQQSRSVDYAAYPAELINQVVVYKTPDAALIGQGLAGTVDIRTIKPLDSTGLQVALNYRKADDGRELPQSGHGQRLSASFVDQFFDHTFGVAIGAARLSDLGGTNDDSGTWGGGTMPYDGQTVNVPYGGLNEESDQLRQERNGILAVLQFKPNDRFETELDLFYSEFKQEDQLWELQFGLTGPTYTCYDAPATVTGGCVPTNPAEAPYLVIRQPQPVLTNAVLNGSNVVSGTITGIRPVIQNIAEGSSQALHSLGWNTKFEATDNLSFAADLNINTAYNQNYDIETYASTPTVFSGTYPPLVPNTTAISFNQNNLGIGSSLNFANRSNTVFTDVLGWSCCQQEQPGYIKYPLVQDTMTAVRLSGRYKLPENGWFSNFDFGLNYSDRQKDNSTTEGYLWVKGTNGALYQNGANIPGNGLAVAGESGLQIPIYNVLNSWSTYFQIGSRATPDILAKTWSVEEKMTTLYGQLQIKADLLGLPLRGNFGLQVVNTKQSSTAYATSQQNPTQDVLAGTPEQVTLGTTTTEWLPSLNLVADLGHQQDLRLGLARQMARPNMADMNASSAVYPGTGQYAGILQGAGGNPYLKPFIADAVDLSFEKYFDTKAYFSAAVFYKYLESFIIDTTEDNFNFAGLVSPTLTGIPSTGGQYTTAVNGSGGHTDGYELTASFPLSLVTPWLEGFGVIGSFSQTESSVVAPTTSAGPNANTLSGSGATNLPGLSKNVYSAQAYFERWGFSARVAKNYRSEFIGTLFSNFGVPGETFIGAYSTVDAQIGYDIKWGPAKGLSFLFQGQNLSNSPQRTYTTTTGGATINKFGEALLFGVNYKFQ
jgi:iron complex outermembrane receptor protein